MGTYTYKCMNCGYEFVVKTVAFVEMAAGACPTKCGGDAGQIIRTYKAPGLIWKAGGDSYGSRNMENQRRTGRFEVDRRI